MSSGQNNTILGSFNGNQNGLDIRTSSNYIVLSDGDGNPNLIIDNNGRLIKWSYYTAWPSYNRKSVK